MIAAAAKLLQRVLLLEAAFTVGTSALVAVAVPKLLLLGPEVSVAAMIALFACVGGAGLVSLGRSAWQLRRHRFVLRTLALGSATIEPFEMEELTKAPWRVTLGWVVPAVMSLGVLVTPLRPNILDLTTGFSLVLLASIIVATLAMPLHVLVRSAFSRAIELAPSDVMREVVEAAARNPLTKRRLGTRVLAATTLPVAFVALGSGLLANAHLRRADEIDREESARALARAALDVNRGVVARAGADEATRKARSLGFSPVVAEGPTLYAVERRDDGLVALRAPLDQGSATVFFSGSTVPVLGVTSLLIMLLALGVAAFLGAALGRALTRDLAIATRGVRLLGTDAVISGGTRMVQPARFGIVADLGRAIERLAERFHVFARAQERSIEAREAATRMRGLFFASVSHDLKSPLNAILGFTELVSAEPLTAEQTESLALIQKRGRELLALIETILDAARVEAGQLSLVHEETDVADLVWQSVDKGRDLGGERETEISVDVPEGLPPLRLDRVRVGRALAMFIGHAVRTAERPPVRVSARPAQQAIVVEVEVPSTRFSALQLTAMLDPGGQGQPGASENRGLALGLSLARSVIELHEGTVEVVDRGPARAVFVVTLPM